MLVAIPSTVAPAIVASVKPTALVAPMIPQREGAGLQDGLSPAYLTALANELHADAWSNVPHSADDDYVRTFGSSPRPVEPAHAAHLAEAVNAGGLRPR